MARRARKKERKAQQQIVALFAHEEDSLEDKLADGRVRDVSYLERRRAPTSPAAAELDGEDDAEHASAYNTLLASLSVPLPSRSAQKKRVRSETSTSVSAQPSKRQRREEDGGADVSWLEQRRELEAAHAAQREQRMAFDEAFDADSDEVDEAEKTGLTEGLEVLTEAEHAGDPYAAHFDREDVSESSAVPEWREDQHMLGNLWSTADVPPKRASLGEYKIKQRLWEPWREHFTTALHGHAAPGALPMTSVQAELLPFLVAYRDLLFCGRTHENQHELTSLYMLHVVNHVLTVRDRVLRNSAKLRAAREMHKELDVRDQGFTRPRVLVLLPTRNDCLEAIELVMRLAPRIQAERVANKRKFYEEFYEDTYVPHTRKPDDWLARFRGHLDDSFRLGVSFTPRFMRLYSDFYKSDVIFASPLGLRLAIEENAGDVDFLSSLELVVLDQAEHHLMQNWEHVRFVFERLNRMPAAYHDADITRIRMPLLNGAAKRLRQTLIFSEIIHADLNELFLCYCQNISGRVKIHTRAGEGTIIHVVPRVKQFFQRLECRSLQAVDDARFAYFCEHVFPHIVAEQTTGVLVFIPSYLDFVRIRNFLRKRRKLGDVSFTQCCEYTPSGHVTRARSNFFHGKRDMMLVTERFHFFNRHMIRGIKKLVFYGPPQFPRFYSELLNLLSDAATAIVLFSRYDVYQLEPLVGTQRCRRLLSSDKTHHMFQ